ncbi:hypothetical protein BB559_004434 [Furculomyces boomerangus]|uniref:Sphingolipid delta4-desaturase N-terminal domain-containing protein n=1 Tax=Furculomyces boomerangus TaxID=61424 RepID=A0A2T9YEV3_9FUNG|nr:hypothetical protein BB559_004434 [Furculomyces boomerangus]
MPPQPVHQKAPDPRHPLYLGKWKSHHKHSSDEGYYDFLDEPHHKRRKTMLAKYPQIAALYGHQPLTALIAVFAVLLQLSVAYYVGKTATQTNKLFLLALTYIVGGTVVGIYGVIIHETCHGLVFKKLLSNRLLSMFVNIPMVVPIAMSFRRYHLEHHQYQGVIGMDPDLPVQAEIELVSKNPIVKFFWVMCYGIMYMVRGLNLGKAPSFWELVNVAWMVAANIALYFIIGGRGLAYLGLSVFFGYGLHPGAAHFIQEHYVFVDGQETYSYYGTGNKLYMNIGYHNEHHDFPQPKTSTNPSTRIALGFCLFSGLFWTVNLAPLPGLCGRIRATATGAITTLPPKNKLMIVST